MRVSDSTSSLKKDSDSHVSIEIRGSVRDRMKGKKEKIKETSRTVVQKLFDDKEQARKIYKDEVFSLDDWRQAKKWYRHLPSFDAARLLRGFLWIVIFHTAVSLLVCSYHYWLEPLGAPGWADNDSDVWQAFNLTSFALALLLVFRTNSAYNRWWEARILWGSQINMTRNIIRMGIAWFPQEEEALLTMFARWTIVMAFALKGNLRGENLTPELQRILPTAELRWASDSSHLCNTTSQMLADIISKVNIHELRRFRIDSELQRYLDIMGSCERILKTPIHRNWTSHTVRFCIIWLTFFPFALWPVYGWATPAIEFVISFLLLGIENIGVQIEEPFAVLALDAYCGVCERSVQQLMHQRHGSKALVEAVQNDKTATRTRSFSLGGHTGVPAIPELAVQSGFHLEHKAGSAPLRGSLDLTSMNPAASI